MLVRFDSGSLSSLYLDIGILLFTTFRFAPKKVLPSARISSKQFSRMLLLRTRVKYRTHVSSATTRYPNHWMMKAFPDPGGSRSFDHTITGQIVQEISNLIHFSFFCVFFVKSVLVSEKLSLDDIDLNYVPAILLRVLEKSFAARSRLQKKVEVGPCAPRWFP